MIDNKYYKIYAFGPRGYERLNILFQEEQIEPYVYSLNPEVYFEALVISHSILNNEDTIYNKYHLFEEKKEKEMGLRRVKK